MDDGNEPDICDQGSLDFVPQRRNLCNKLLVYSDQLDLEIAKQLRIIKDNLPKAIILSENDNSVIEWVNALHRFVFLRFYLVVHSFGLGILGIPSYGTK